MELKKVDVAYSSDPWWYDVRGFLILTFAYRTTLWSQIGLFSHNMGARHLEAAIGTGTLFELVLRWRRLRRRSASSVVGFDYADRMLAGAQHRFRKEQDIELIKADISVLPFANGEFDTVNIANAIHCVPDVDSGLRELRRVLKVGGTLAGNVLLEPATQSFANRIARRINAWGIRKGILNRPYTRDEIRRLVLANGFVFQNEIVDGNSYSFVVVAT
ncbi:hypothetical protein BH10BDE1_BH10BDE1_22890 [soil metagenome]